MPTLQDLAATGQSVWLDTLSRDMLDSGELQSWIDQGVKGVTSNPTIQQKALTGSAVYDDEIRRLVRDGRSVIQIYEQLIFDDITRALDLFRPIYDATNGGDGFVSLEVDPHKAYDTGGTIEEVRRLFAAVDRPNLMVKIPATKEGIPAIEQLTSEGRNINITLLFSVDRYRNVMNAYMSGLERFAHAGGDLRQVNSVASFFVSRVDTAVDKQLEKVGNQELRGHIAVANAKMGYALFRAFVTANRWEHLYEMGARVQRPLWASTGTKNPAYSDTKYVDELVGPFTVNTMPPATLRAFLDHGSATSRIDLAVDEAEIQIGRLTELGIHLDQITQQLEEDGVRQFAQSFDDLLVDLAHKRDRFAAEQRRAA